MKTIGIIGGLGPPSTLKYYEWLVSGVQARLGGVNAPRILLTSVNGEDVRQLRLTGDPAREGAFYAREALRLQNAGADFILIASNTSHKNAPAIEQAVTIPLLHIATATAQAILAQGLQRIALLGTAPTMEDDFYISKLRAAGLEVIVPDADTRRYISDTIYNELVRNIVTPDTSARFSAIINTLASTTSVQGVILGCTELTLLDLADSKAMLFDTARIHVEAAIAYALNDSA